MIEKLENGLKMSFIMFWNLNGAFLRLRGTKFPSACLDPLDLDLDLNLRGV